MRSLLIVKNANGLTRKMMNALIFVCTYIQMKPLVKSLSKKVINEMPEAPKQQIQILDILMENLFIFNPVEKEKIN